MTGWRLGYASGASHIIEKMALIQDYLYVCPVTPLQWAGISALMIGEEYYQNLQQSFAQKRALTVSALQDLGFEFSEPQGAYYILEKWKAKADISGQVLMNTLMEKAHVATVAGQSFYQSNHERGNDTIRICYALDSVRLEQAFNQISQLNS